MSVTSSFAPCRRRADLLVDLLELEADLVEDREAVVVEVVEHLVEEPARAAARGAARGSSSLSYARRKSSADRPQLDRRQRDEVVRADEDVELAGVEPADRRVVDREVENGEEVAARGACRPGVDVDLRPLAAREDVLDVERVPAEAAREQLRLLGRRAEEMDPGDAAGAEAQRGAGARLDDRSPGAPRRERMRGRLGTGTEGVGGRGHGPGMLPARRSRQDRNGFSVRRPAHPLGQARLERERAGGASEVDAGGDRPQQQRPVLEEESAGRRADDPADLPRDARRRRGSGRRAAAARGRR